MFIEIYSLVFTLKPQQGVAVPAPRSSALALHATTGKQWRWLNVCTEEAHTAPDVTNRELAAVKEASERISAARDAEAE